eukprot:6172065-Pleurochrysis_carterae.AAC.4
MPAQARCLGEEPASSFCPLLVCRSRRRHSRRLVNALREIGGDACMPSEAGDRRRTAAAAAALRLAALTEEPDPDQAPASSSLSGADLESGKRACTPREAFFRARKSVSAEAAVGEISAELVCPYPPGIPLLVPGERIGADALAELLALRDAGCTISGASDADLDTIWVLA